MFPELQREWDIITTTMIPLNFVLYGFILLLCINVVRLYPRKTQRDAAMGENEDRLKRENKRVQVSDAFHDALLDLWAEGKITREDYWYYCKNLGMHFGFNDLVRRADARRLHPELVKRKLEILKRHLQIRKKEREKKVESPSIVAGEVVSLSERLRRVAGK